MGLWRVNRACRGFRLPAGRCPTGEMVREIPQETHVFIQRDIGSQEGHAHAAFAPATLSVGRTGQCIMMALPRRREGGPFLPPALPTHPPFIPPSPRERSIVLRTWEGNLQTVH